MDATRVFSLQNSSLSMLPAVNGPDSTSTTVIDLPTTPVPVLPTPIVSSSTPVLSIGITVSRVAADVGTTPSEAITNTAIPATDSTSTSTINVISISDQPSLTAEQTIDVLTTTAFVSSPKETLSVVLSPTEAANTMGSTQASVADLASSSIRNVMPTTNKTPATITDSTSVILVHTISISATSSPSNDAVPSKRPSRSIKPGIIAAITAPIALLFLITISCCVYIFNIKYKRTRQPSRTPTPFATHPMHPMIYEPRSGPLEARCRPSYYDSTLPPPYFDIDSEIPHIFQSSEQEKPG
ncbi:hypothetical protein BDQ17DRAFT_1426655 [Cyathus striatus]|nr:hypothetical protein BDQ17DRAFT_1426655 [Cyathus striatus]